MAKKTTLRTLIAQARQAQRAIETPIEPDSNADPVTVLDHQWRQERETSMGIAAVGRGTVMGSPLLLIGFVVLFFTLGVVSGSEHGALSGYALLFIGMSLVSLLFLPNSIRHTRGEQRYRQQRATLMRLHGAVNHAPDSLGAAHRLSYPRPTAPRSAAEMDFHALQAASYHSATRNRTYWDQLQQCINKAPDADQGYLNTLVQFEHDWVKERVTYMTYDDETGSYQEPTSFGAWIALSVGLGLISIGLKFAADGNPWTHSVLFCAFGIGMIIVCLEVRRTKIAFDAAEQRYFVQRQTCSQSYGRSVSKEDEREQGNRTRRF